MNEQNYFTKVKIFVEEGLKEQNTFEYHKALDKYKDAEQIIIQYYNVENLKLEYINQIHYINFSDNFNVNDEMLKILDYDLSIKQLQSECHLKLNFLDICIEQLINLINYSNKLSLTLKSPFNFTPHLLKTYFLLGSAYFHNKKYDKSLLVVDKLLEINIEYISAYLLKCDVYFALFKNNEDKLDKDNQQIKINYKDLIFETLNKLLEIDKLQSHFKKGAFYIQFSNYEIAIEELKKVHQILLIKSKLSDKEKDIIEECTLMISNCYQKLNDFDQAINYLNLALSYDSENDEVYLNLGQINYILGQYDSALLEINKALKFNPYLQEALMLKKEIYKKLGDTKQVEIIENTLNKTHFGFFD